MIYKDFNISDINVYHIELMAEHYNSQENVPIRVWSKETVPQPIRDLCNFNGGDEDWYVMWPGKAPDYMPFWLEKTDTCNDPDVYVFNNCVIYVGSHA